MQPRCNERTVEDIGNNENGSQRREERSALTHGSPPRNMIYWTAGLAGCARYRGFQKYRRALTKSARYARGCTLQTQKSMGISGEILSKGWRKKETNDDNNEEVQEGVVILRAPRANYVKI